MLTIGIDPHKQTHSAVAVDEVGAELAVRTEPARRQGFGELLIWSRSLAGEHVWVITVGATATWSMSPRPPGMPRL